MRLKSTLRGEYIFLCWHKICEGKMRSRKDSLTQLKGWEEWLLNNETQWAPLRHSNAEVQEWSDKWAESRCVSCINLSYVISLRLLWHLLWCFHSHWGFSGSSGCNLLICLDRWNNIQVLHYHHIVVIPYYNMFYTFIEWNKHFKNI